MGLRISKIEKVLAKRKDLTQQQRRRLQSRKNTANFRERQKNTIKLKLFINYEIDAIVNSVSTLCLEFLRLLAPSLNFGGSLWLNYGQKCMLFLIGDFNLVASTWG